MCAVFRPVRAAVLVLAVSVPIAVGHSAEQPKKPAVRVTISKQTTFITEPLRPDGYPDYLEALNRIASKGVTPENNAVVLLVKAFGPKGIHEKIRTEYFKRLGIEPLPEQGDYFVDYYDYVNRTAPEALKSTTDADGEECPSEADQQLDSATSRPWSKADCPLVAGWLEVNQEPLRLIVEASARGRYYAPMVGASEDGTVVFAALLPDVANVRQAARTLVARAHWHISQGDTEQAIADLLAVRRLGRLVAQNPTLVEGLVGIAIEGMACGGDANLAHHGKLTLQQADGYRQQLRKLPPLPNMIDKADVAERLIGLDAICAIARGQRVLDELELRTMADPRKPVGEKALKALNEIKLWLIYDADLILRTFNQHYDRLVAAGRLPTFAQRQEALQQVEKQFEERRRAHGWPSSLATRALKNFSLRKAASQELADILVSLFTPALRSCLVAQQRAETLAKLSEVVLALGAYRTEHGQYPAELAALVPKYIDKLPSDPYSGDQLKYRREKEGYVLYAVGPNLKDDNGYGMQLLGERKPSADEPFPVPDDDVGVRVPLPEHR